MGALEDDLDFGLKVEREKNRQSHTLINSAAKWDDLQCIECDRRGGVDLSFNKCIKAGSTMHEVGCTCGFCKLGWTR